jgi:hypothetical protein
MARAVAQGSLVKSSGIHAPGAKGKVPYPPRCGLFRREKMKATIKTEDGRIFTGDLVEEKQEPRPGQLCRFWDDECIGRSVSTLVRSVNGRYINWVGHQWRHAEVLRDPLILGRTLAPEGAEWIAPYANGVWAFYYKQPEGKNHKYYDVKYVIYAGPTIQTFPAPTECGEAMKLWED